jgi:exonuclease VII small subunit
MEQRIAFVFAVSVLTANAAGCATPSFNVPSAPSAPDTTLETPTPPDPEAVDPPSITPSVETYEVESEDGELSANPGLAIAVDGTSEQTERYLQENLTFSLVRANLSRLVDVDDIGRVAVHDTDGSSEGKKWKAKLADLVRVRPFGNVDALLALEVESTQQITIQRTKRYRVPEKKLQRYRKNYEQFTQRAEKKLESAKDALREYNSRFRQARDTYASKSDRLFVDTTHADNELERGKQLYDQRSRSLGRAETEMQRLLRQTPSPEELVEDAREREETGSQRMFGATLRATLVDAEDMRILWAANMKTVGWNAPDVFCRLIHTVKQRTVDYTGVTSPSGTTSDMACTDYPGQTNFRSVAKSATGGVGNVSKTKHDSADRTDSQTARESDQETTDQSKGAAGENEDPISKLKAAGNSTVTIERKDGTSVTGQLFGIRRSRVVIEDSEGEYRKIPKTSVSSVRIE